MEITTETRRHGGGREEGWGDKGKGETRGKGAEERKPESQKAGRQESECVRKWGRGKEQGEEYGELVSL